MKRIINVLIGISFLASCNHNKEESLVISETDSNEIIIPEYIPANQQLHDTIIALDKLLWDAYNTGNDSITINYVTNDFKFFHDYGGLTSSKNSFSELVTKSNNNHKDIGLIGETVSGTNEVYEIPNYGAIQLSYQRFKDNEYPEWSIPARTITVWEKTPNGWLQSQMISLHDKSDDEE